MVLHKSKRVAPTNLTMITVKKLVKRFGLKIVLRGWTLMFSLGSSSRCLVRMARAKRHSCESWHRFHALPGGSDIAGYRLPNEASSVRARLGVVSHLPLLYGDLRAEENLRFYGRMYGLTIWTCVSPKCWTWLAWKPPTRPCQTFSRGMQQRLAIGRAVLHDPDVMLFDEPYTGLDQDASTMLDEVLKTVAAKGRTVVMTSHDSHARKIWQQGLIFCLAGLSLHRAAQTIKEE